MYGLSDAARPFNDILYLHGVIALEKVHILKVTVIIPFFKKTLDRPPDLIYLRAEVTIVSTSLRALKVNNMNYYYKLSLFDFFNRSK